MTAAESRQMSDHDAAMLRRAIELAQMAQRQGELPFGAVIAHGHGAPVVETISTEISSGDWTCHAETNAVRLVGPTIDRDQLKHTTIYASSEPCAMCAAAIFYSGIRRIVFGFSESQLRPLLAKSSETVGLGYSCREILAHAAEPVEIHGPFLEEEAKAPHENYWGAKKEGA